MLGQHLVIEGLVRVIIIPIAHFQILRDHVNDALRNVRFHIIVIVDFRPQTEEHVAPHHGLVMILAANLHDPVQVTVQNAEAILNAVLFHVPAQTDAVRLVHADVNAA